MSVREPSETMAVTSIVSAIPEATIPPGIPATLREGPVRCVLVSGALDDGSWGIVGTFWLSIDGARGGLLVAPAASRAGEDLATRYREDRDQGLTPEEAYAAWRERTGIAGDLMIDPQHHADTLLQVAERVGAR